MKIFKKILPRFSALPASQRIGVLVLFFLFALPLTVFLSQKQQQIQQQAATNYTGWFVRDMGMTAITHDTVCNQYSQNEMKRLVGYIAQFHANFASDDVPYDDASNYPACGHAPADPYSYIKAWADTMHAASLHVIYRGNWNNWAGDFGTPKLSYNTNPAIAFEGSGGLQAVLSGQDTTSYMGKTYQWILHHPDLFQKGDIFEPFGEPQNNGIKNGPPGTSASYCPKGVCQFPSTAAFNQWLSDFAQADQAAFAKIGKQVYSGWYGLAGDSYTYITPEALAHADVYNMDHFTMDFTKFTLQLQATYNKFHKPIIVEWGDFQDGGSEPATANATDQFLGWLAQQPYVEGEEYWQLTGSGSNGPEHAIDFKTGRMSPAGQIVAKWFGLESNGSLPLTSITPKPFSTLPNTSAPSAMPLQGSEEDDASHIKRKKR